MSVLHLQIFDYSHRTSPEKIEIRFSVPLLIFNHHSQQQLDNPLVRRDILVQDTQELMVQCSALV